MDTAPAPEPLRLGWNGPLSTSAVKLALLLLAGCAATSWLEAGLRSAGLAPRPQLFAVLGAALLAGATAARGGGMFRLLSGLPFAIAQISALSGVALAASAAKHWPAAKSALGWAMEPFDRLGIQALLALLALSTLAVAWKRRPYRPSRFGFLMVHLAPSLLLLGAFWNGVAGQREVLIATAGATVPLPAGLGLRLLDLEIAPEGREHKLFVYRKPAGSDAFLPTPAVLPETAGSRLALPDPRCELEVLQALPDALLERRFREDPAAAEDPALFLLLGIGAEPAPRGYLFSRRPGLDRQAEPGGRFTFQFQEAWSEAILKQQDAGKGHGMLRVVQDDHAEERPVRPGMVWELASCKLARITEFPDFAVRPGADGRPQPYSRSPQPNEPWLTLDLVPAQGEPRRLLLSARDPKKSEALNAAWMPPGLRLEYHWESAANAQRRVVFTRKDLQVRLVEQGRVIRREPLVAGRPFIVEPGLSLLPLELIRHPVEDPSFTAHSGASPAGRAANPALQVRVRQVDGKEEVRWLEARGPEGEPTRAMAMEGRLGLVYRLEDPKPGDLKARLAVFDSGGRELAQGWASALQPMIFQGLQLRPRGLATDGPGCAVEAVKDPGRFLLGAGWLLLLIGMAWMFYLKPVLKRKEGAS